VPWIFIQAVNTASSCKRMLRGSNTAIINVVLRISRFELIPAVLLRIQGEWFLGVSRGSSAVIVKYLHTWRGTLKLNALRSPKRRYLLRQPCSDTCSQAACCAQSTAILDRNTLRRIFCHCTQVSFHWPGLARCCVCCSVPLFVPSQQTFRPFLTSRNNTEVFPPLLHSCAYEECLSRVSLSAVCRMSSGLKASLSHDKL
jgi:hypothetical protein